MDDRAVVPAVADGARQPPHAEAAQLEAPPGPHGEGGAGRRPLLPGDEDVDVGPGVMPGPVGQERGDPRPAQPGGDVGHDVVHGATGTASPTRMRSRAASPARNSARSESSSGGASSSRWRTFSMRAPTVGVPSSRLKTSAPISLTPW